MGTLSFEERISERLRKLETEFASFISQDRPGSLAVPAGRIPFGATSQALTNSANLIWDATNNRLGISAPTPAAPLHINAGNIEAIRLQSSTAGASFMGHVTSIYAGGNIYFDGTNWNLIDTSAAGWLIGAGSTNSDTFSLLRAAAAANPVSVLPTLLALSSVGNLTVAGRIRPNNVAAMSYQAREINSLAVNAVAQLTNITGNDVAFVFILDDAGTGAGYILNGGTHTTQELFDPSNAYGIIAGTAGLANIYYSVANGRYEIENKRATTRTFKAFSLSFS